MNTAIQALEIEAAALQKLASNIGQDFVDAIENIKNSEGRIIISGIGKTAIIAQKIVATLNSTGSPAIFLHAADAIHGDLGIIQKGDVLIIISKSGETEEIKVLLPLIKNFGNTVIAMVCSEHSYLAKHADIALKIPLEQEADPNNLAPTTSTTLQLAMGDAIATSLLALKGFTPSDFAQFHPGGAIGKQLYLRVSEVALKNEKPAIKLTDNIRTTIIEISGKRLGATVVLDQEDNVCGIITDGDLRRMLQSDKDVSVLAASDIMTSNPKRIAKDALAVEAFNIMKENSISQLVVMDGEAYFGIVHVHDLMKEGII
ncbi:MAG: KpsF/GutQ family sugar-phosphate isomerase [Bacteroidota bacterium]